LSFFLVSEIFLYSKRPMQILILNIKIRKKERKKVSQSGKKYFFLL